MNPLEKQFQIVFFHQNTALQLRTFPLNDNK